MQPGRHSHPAKDLLFAYIAGGSVGPEVGGPLKFVRPLSQVVRRRLGFIRILSVEVFFTRSGSRAFIQMHMQWI